MQSIVIDREYGSGGREVAKILADILGIKYYDGNLLEIAGERLGVDLGMMKDFDEKGTGSILHDLSLFSNMLSGSDVHTKRFEVYEATANVIRQLAKEKSCIFLGRCADEILNDHVPFLHVFVYADNLKDRIQRALDIDNIPPEKAAAYVRKKDLQRKNYRKFFCNKDWAVMSDYDMCLNTSALGYEKAAKAIAAVIKAVPPKDTPCLYFDEKSV